MTVGACPGPGVERRVEGGGAGVTMDFATFVSELGGARWRAENRVVVERIDSTNRLARQVVGAYHQEEMTPPELLVLAFEQVAGRGRQGRAWLSPAGGGVYATRVLTVAGAAELQTVPLLAAIGLARALGALLPAGRCGLKWPNDLMVGGRKLGGVLVESVARAGGESVAMIGFGINYRPVEGSARIARAASPAMARATWLTEELSELPPLGDVARSLVEGLEAELEHLGDASYAAERFRALSVHRPGEIIRCRLANELVTGELVGFDERGFLRLSTDVGETLISAGEIVESAGLAEGGGGR